MTPDIINKITNWFKSQNEVNGILLVGSYARGDQHSESDIDLVILVNDISFWVNSTTWANKFGTVLKFDIEDWGPLTAIRCFYSDCEVEFGFALNSWANIDPVDSGNQKVVSNGAKILYDPKDYFSSLLGKVRK